MLDTAAHLENLAQTLQQLAPGLVFWSGVGFLDAVPDALRDAVGEEWGPESVDGYLSYLSFSKSDEDRRLTVVLAAPSPPDQLAALLSLQSVGYLASVVVLERRRPTSFGGWTVPSSLSPLIKRHSATGGYLEELGFQEGGWIEWESTEKDQVRLLESLETATAQALGYVVVTCEDTGGDLEAEARQTPYVLPPSRRPVKADPSPTVYARFAQELPGLVAPNKLLWLDESSADAPKAMEQHLRMFSTLERDRSGRPVLVVPSSLLPGLYGELRAWCTEPAGEPPLLVVHGSGIPADRSRGAGGLTDGHLLLSIPELMVAKPADEAEARVLFAEAMAYPGAAALVFSQAPAVGLKSPAPDAPGRGRRLREGKDLAILALGSTVFPSLLAAESLQAVGLQVAVYDLRYRRPMDRDLLALEGASYPLLVTVEEGPQSSSFASHLFTSELKTTRMLRLSVEVADLKARLAEDPHPLSLESFGMHAEGIARAVKEALQMGTALF